MLPWWAVALILVGSLALLVGVLIPLVAYGVCWSYTKDRPFRLKHHDRQAWAARVAAQPEPGFAVLDQVDLTGRSVVTASLYGTADKYFAGAARLVEAVARDLDGWDALVYVHDQVAPEWVQGLRDRGALVVRVHDPLVAPGNSSGMFWRFLPLTQPCRFLVYDTDDALDAPRLDTLVHRWEVSQQPYVRLMLGTPYPWPRDHVTGKWWGHDGRNGRVDFDRVECAHRSTFGSDELYLTHSVYPVMAREGLLTVYPHAWSAYLHTWSPPFRPTGKGERFSWA